ncbi:hypothetical protein J6590_037273 [Homalodisca vitripennis]|nr:hypothetical protein J6590_037273 [Homalodisca vitripennis]
MRHSSNSPDSSRTLLHVCPPMLLVISDSANHEEQECPFPHLVLQEMSPATTPLMYNTKRPSSIRSTDPDAGNRHRIASLQTVTLVHKVLVTGEPSYLRRKLVARATLRERHTRQDDKLQLPRVRLEATKRSFSYFGPQEYNALPPVIKTLNLKYEWRSRKLDPAMKVQFQVSMARSGVPVS